MSGTLTICIIACYKTKDVNETCPDDLFSIGASTFYGGRRLVERQEGEFNGGISNQGVRQDVNDRNALRLVFKSYTPIKYFGAFLLIRYVMN